MIQIAELINHFVNGIVDMKIKKAQAGLCAPSGKRGGGVSRGSSGAPKTEGYKPGRRIKFDGDVPDMGKIRRVGEALKLSGKTEKESSTAPGIRGTKKGGQSFFGRDREDTEARYGRKVSKKSSVKKAKMGKKVSKQSKKK